MVAAHSIVPLNQDNAINVVAALKAIVYRLRDEQMIEGQDYGKIPGTNDKPVLLLPGMEKLMRALNAVPVYTEKHIIRDFDKPLFYFEYECRLVDADSGIAIPGGLAIGLATSFESKWRWRKGERTCPNCGKANIRKSKDKPEFYCWAKTDGCGAVFKDTDPAIINQAVGRIENVDIFDQINTICKIAQKRALSSAIKGAAAVSEFFTVDLEDYSDQIITVVPEVIESGINNQGLSVQQGVTKAEFENPPKATNVTNIETARQTLGSGNVERRAPYDQPKAPTINVVDGNTARRIEPEIRQPEETPDSAAPTPPPADPAPVEDISKWEHYQVLMAHESVKKAAPESIQRKNLLALLKNAGAFNSGKVSSMVWRIQTYRKLREEGYDQDDAARAAATAPDELEGFGG